MADNGRTINLSKEKNFKYTLKLNNGDNNYINFLNTSSDKISISEKGNDVIISVYDNEDITKIRGTVTLTNGINVFPASGSSVNINVDGINCFDLLNPLSYITAPTKSGNKYTGNWLNESGYSTRNNETFNLGTGALDRITWNYALGKHGNDTITLNKNETLFLNAINKDGVTFEYKKSGSDAIIQAQKFIKDFAADYYKITYSLQESADGKKYNYVFTTQILLDNLEYEPTGTTYSGSVSKSFINLAKSFGYNIDINKYLTDGATVYADLKNGFNFEQFYKAIKNIETDTIKSLNTLTSMKKQFDGNISKTVPALSHYEYETVFGTFNITLKNYFSLGSALIKNGEVLSVIADDFNLNSGLLNVLNSGYDHSGENNKVTMTDTFLSGEDLYGGNNNDTINITGGEDYVTGGKGKDTINVNYAHTNINYNFGNNDGKDTVNIGKNATVDITFTDDSTEGLVYTKSGNNLVISEKNGSTDNNITIKNYLNGKTNPEVLTLFYNNGEVIVSDSPDFNNESYLSWIGSDVKKNSITASKFNDEIFAGKQTTSINAGEGSNKIYQSNEGQKISISSGKGNDEFYVNDLSKTVTINDLGGDDTLIFSSDFNKLLFFDVSKTKTGTELNIIDMGNAESIEDFVNNIKTNKNKLNITPSVKINNYFTTSGNTGKGYIENCDIIDGYDFEGVMSDVAGWLETYGKQYGFSSVSQFLSKGAGEHTTELATELFGIYNSGYNIQ